MEGKNFFRATVTPPPITNLNDFIFDLQRFKEMTVEEGATTPPDGAKFSVTNGNTTKYYDADSDFSTLNLQNATDIKILDDIKLSDNVGSSESSESSINQTITVANDATLDLNGKTLYTSAAIGINIENNKTFTVTDTTSEKKGTIHSTLNDGTDGTKNTHAVILVGEKNESNEDSKTYSPRDATFKMEGGNIESAISGVLVPDGSNVEISGGNITSSKNLAIYFGNTGHGGGSLTMTGGHLKATGNQAVVQVTGNHINQTTKIDISGGTLEYAKEVDSKVASDKAGNKAAIYCAGKGEVTISNTARLVSTYVGIEIRAGTLNVEGGTIVAGAKIDDSDQIVSTEANQYTDKIFFTDVKTDNSGTKSSGGVAISVDQHTTQKAIDVNISGGNVSGYAALAIFNPQNNPAFGTGTTKKTTNNSLNGESNGDGNYTVGEVKVDITGGTLTSTSKATEDKITQGTTSNEFSIVGKNAILNADSRVTVNISNATVNGSIAATTNGRASNYPNGYNIGEGNEFSNFTYSSSKQLTSFYQVDGSVDTFAVNVLGANEDWNIDPFKTNEWRYLVSSGGTSASAIATLAPAEGASTITLNLKTADSGTGTITLDLTDTTFKNLTTFTTLDGSKITNASFAFDIMGNDTLKAITSGAGNDTLRAGAKGVTLDGGAGADSLVGGKGEDTFIYSGGEDVINNYDIENDVVSVASDITPTTDTTKIESLSTGLKLTFGDGNTLSFDKNAVSIVSGDDTYYYTPNSILLNGTSISLGANHDSLFNATSSDYRDNLKDIDASKVLKEIRIIGNDLNNVIIGGASGSIFGGDGNDTLKAGANGSTLNGGEGDDSLVGGAGADTFIFNSGADSINGYDSTKDLVSIPDSLRPESAIVSVDSSNNLVLDFDGGDKLTFVSAKASVTTEDLAVSLTSNDRNMYIFKKDRVETYLFDKDSILLSKSVSLTSAYDTNAAFEVSDYDSVDASAVTGAVSILGGEENKSSYIIGSNKGGTLGGGAGGNDRLDVNDRDNSSKYTFVYTAGRDTVFGFEDGDNVSLTAESIASAKNGNGKFTFTIKANKNVLTLNGEDVDKVNLTGGNYLTADGFVDTQTSSLKLFTSANGTIDLTDDPYKGTTINSVIADSVKSQSVHLVASSLVSAVTFAEKNKMKDVFEYNGGNVTVTNYEVGKDKINLEDGEIKGFSVNGNDVEISVDGYSGNDNKVTLKDVAGKEILVHHAESKGSNTYDKMIFKESNVLFNKDSSATSVTISSGAQGFSVGNNTSIKKITVESGVSGINITAGDSNNTTIDASASDGVTLIGGKKNDKLFGSTEKNDTFVYGNEGTAKSGKDVIQNYGDGDKVSLRGDNFKLDKVQKVAASNNSVKLTFDNSNILTIKGEVSSDDGISIGGKKYTFKKNAIIGTDAIATLTSGASGNIKLDKLGGVATVTAENVDKNKNLTLTGTKEADSIVGGGKKTTFKGGGDNDTLVGGSGADTFVYTKGIAGDVTIQNFDFANDNLKIANGTITSISSVAGGVKFSMNNGRKNSNNIGYFTVTSSIASGSEGTAIDPSKIVIKANNNFYWFASGGEVLSSDDTKKATLGDLITASGSKKSDFDSSFNVIDLGYSTNLVKSGVAFKVNSPYKKTTT